jgi:hypothetical protein
MSYRDDVVALASHGTHEFYRWRAALTQRLITDPLRARDVVVELLAPTDAVVVPCGPDSIRTLSEDGYAVHFVAEAFRHAKPVAAFATELSRHRAWDRATVSVPA